LDQERTYKWIQERLRELNSGTLSEQDLARLKDIARNDPFVADALEGFHAHPNGEHAHHLHVIEQKIKQTKRERRRWLIPNLAVTAIAASVLLIIATYAVIMRIEKDSQETVFVFVAPDSLLTGDTAVTDLALEEETKSLDETGAESAGKPSMKESAHPAQPSSTSSRDKTDIPIPPGPETKSTGIATSAEPAKTPDVIEPLPGATMKEDDDAKSVAEGVVLSSKTEIARSKKDEGYFANQMNAAQMNSRVTGRVVNAQRGEAIAGAKLSVNYTNQLFYTDILGNFELSVPEPDAVLQVTFTGLTDSTLIIRPGEENIVVGLNEGAMIPQMVTSGANTKGPVSSKKNPAIESHLLFTSYLASSSSLQLTTEPSAARRKVTIAFKVRKDGRPVDINVSESSRDKTYDEEAKRLIDSGPEWVCPGGEYPCVRQYTFYFR
jgi:hypothetical protein